MTMPETQRAVTFGYGPDNDLWPFTLLEGAKSFLRVADNAVARMAPIQVGGSDHLTILFLLAQSLELSLKTFLRLHGRSEEELMELGHRLAANLDAAVRAGFPGGHPCDRKLLNLLDLTYDGKRELQYRRASEVGIPFLRLVRELAVEYAALVGGSRGQPLDDGTPDYGTPSLSELRKHSPGIDLRQLATGWIASEKS